MSRLVALYPRRWRDRYGAELSELLANRPPAWRDRLDIVLGALDARLDPQLEAEPQRRFPNPTDRTIGLATVAAGLLVLLWAVCGALYAPRWNSDDVPTSALVTLAWAAGAVGSLVLIVVILGLAARYASTIGEVGVLAACATALGLLGSTMGGGLVALAILLVGSLGLSRAIGRAVVGGVPAAAHAIGAVVLVAMFLAFGASEGQDIGLFWLATLYGLGWVTVGSSLIRGPLTALAQA